MRYALNAAEGSRDPDSPHHEIANATPYLFGEQQLAETDDFKEGAQAFFEKRQPDFAGR